MSQQNPSETDSLLSHQNPIAGSDDSDAVSYGSTLPVQANGNVQNNDEESSRKAKDDDNPLFVGLPEVKKKLKYIVPAVGIGVFLAAADQTIIVASYGTIGSELNALNDSSWIATA